MTQSSSVVKFSESQAASQNRTGLEPYQRMKLAVQFVGVMSATEKSKRYERLMLVAMLHVNRLEEISRMTNKEIGALISSMPVGGEY